MRAACEVGLRDSPHRHIPGKRTNFANERALFCECALPCIFCASLAFNAQQDLLRSALKHAFYTHSKRIVTRYRALLVHLHLSSPPGTNAHSSAFSCVRSCVAGPCALKAHPCILHSCAFMCILMHPSFLVHSCALEQHCCALGSSLELCSG